MSIATSAATKILRRPVGRQVASWRTTTNSRGGPATLGGVSVRPMESALVRSFSAAAAPESQKSKVNQGDPTSPSSLKDTVERLQRNQAETSTTTTTNTASNSAADDDTKNQKTTFEAADILRNAADHWDSFRQGVGATWQQLIKSGERKSINKKIHPVETAGGDAPYTGPVDILVIDPAEHLTSWERMQKRLSQAPIIHDMLERSEKVYVQSGAKQAKEKVDHLQEDAREAWETSQNPWVYRISSVYDTVTAATPESIAVAELRKLDQGFSLEDWRQDVVENTLPIIMAWFLEGRINQLKPWLGESVFKRMAAEMTAREKEGTQIDTHVLGIMNSEILAIEVSCVRS